MVIGIICFVLGSWVGFTICSLLVMNKLANDEIRGTK